MLSVRVISGGSVRVNSIGDPASIAESRKKQIPRALTSRVCAGFSLELIHAANPERGPDMLLTFPWTSRPNAFGVPGTDRACVAAGAAPLISDHGSMSPWNVRNTLLGWGASFKKRTIVRAPAGNVDVTPTVLSLLGITERDGLDGRVLAEALTDGPDEEQLAAETRVHTVEAGAYRAALQISTVDGRRYIDKSWRER